MSELLSVLRKREWHIIAERLCMMVVMVVMMWMPVDLGFMVMMVMMWKLTSTRWSRRDVQRVDVGAV